MRGGKSFPPVSKFELHGGLEVLRFPPTEAWTTSKLSSRKSWAGPTRFTWSFLLPEIHPTLIFQIMIADSQVMGSTLHILGFETSLLLDK